MNLINCRILMNLIKLYCGKGSSSWSYSAEFGLREVKAVGMVNPGRQCNQGLDMAFGDYKFQG